MTAGAFDTNGTFGTGASVDAADRCSGPFGTFGTIGTADRSVPDLAPIFAAGKPVFLSFSGGKDSIVLAHICEPWRDALTLIWSNPGFPFPHQERFIRSYAERGFRLVEVKSDLMAHWQEHGLPADIVPADHLTTTHKGPKLNPWWACCYAARGVPMAAFASEQPVPGIVLHGQRRDDGAPGIVEHVNYQGWEVKRPLWDWSTVDVMTYVAEHALTLPPQYAYGADSLECWCCPANFTPGRLAFMREHYPDQLNRVLPIMKRVHDAGRDALNGVADRIAEIEQGDLSQSPRPTAA
jgi:3'-phosphoadenosine 5'-phosphosulfate sulfotransferase (PAPS reductase)/FAD synthetase